MDRNCTDACFGKKPLKMDESTSPFNKFKRICMSKCPTGNVKNGNECTLQYCDFRTPYTFNNTCYAECPPGKVPNSAKACVPFDPLNFWPWIVSIVLFSFSFFFLFAMICCFKGSTELNRCMSSSKSRSEVCLMNKHNSFKS